MLLLRKALNDLMSLADPQLGPQSFARYSLGFSYRREFSEWKADGMQNEASRYRTSRNRLNINKRTANSNSDISCNEAILLPQKTKTISSNHSSVVNSVRTSVKCSNDSTATRFRGVAQVALFSHLAPRHEMQGKSVFSRCKRHLQRLQQHIYWFGSFLGMIRFRLWNLIIAIALCPRC